MQPEHTKETSAKYLRELADKIESGKATCYVVAHLETCEKCPEQHSQIGCWLDPSSMTKLGMAFVGMASFVHGFAMQHLRHLEINSQFASMIAQHEAKEAVKQ